MTLMICSSAPRTGLNRDRFRRNGRKRFRYLLVDEFQDINPVQQRLIRIWSRPGRELFVIGDPDQAIYGFRGADPFCFERMAEEKPGIWK